MIFRVRTIALTLISSVVLVACGGGGGGGTTTSAGPAAVAITESTAKPVAASALGAAQGTSATDSAGLLTGVTVQGDAGVSPGGLKAMAETARFAAGSLAGSGSLVTGVTSTETVNCPSGGTLTASGTVSGSSGMVAGDNVTLTANNCSMSIDGQTATINGSLAFTVISGSITGTLPMNVVFSMVATNFSVTNGSTTVAINGDLRMDLRITSTSETIVASGASLSSRLTEGGTTYTDTLKNYSQSFTYNGSVITGSLSGTVESSSTILGSGGGSFAISTPTPLVWNESTGTLSSGVIKVVGAGGSQLVMTVTSSTSVTIQIDENGDGTFEKTVTATQTELRNLL